MTKLHIPTIGARMKLLNPWVFDLMDEHRNDGFFKICGFCDTGTVCHGLMEEARSRFPLSDDATLRDAIWSADYYGMRSDKVWARDFMARAKIVKFSFTLPADTVLILDRLYIRKGAGEFDSLTFMVESAPDGTFRNPPAKKNLAFGRKPRFWVKLDDANNLDVEFL